MINFNMINFNADVIASLLFNDTSFKNDRNSGYRSFFIHKTKKGPGRSGGMKRKSNPAGSKIGKKCFNGMLTLRNGCGAAGRLAIENKLGSRCTALAGCQ